MAAPVVAAVGRAALGAGRAGGAGARAGGRARQLDRALDTAESLGVQASQLTAVALRISWQTLIASFGLTLFYVNFHFLARYLGGSRKFCEFGSEWSPRSIATGKPSFGLKYAEFLALFFLDALAIMAILAIAALLGMVVYAITHPCEFIGKIGYTYALVFAALSGPSGAAVAAVVGGCAAVNAVSG